MLFLLNAIIVITYLQSMTVEAAPRLSIRRPHSVLLKDGSAEFFMAFESKEDKVQWMDDMNQVHNNLVHSAKL